MSVLYISSARIKRDTALGSTVDDNILNPYIQIAQDRWILPVLGTDLDEYLKGEIATPTLSSPTCFCRSGVCSTLTIR